MSKYEQLINGVEEHVLAYIKEHFNKDLLYHNKRHITDVVSAAKKLAKKSSLNEEDSAALTIAAWFHDVGYDLGQENHEERSVSKMREYLEKQDVDPAMVDEIGRLILATQLSHDPSDQQEALIKDADFCHMAQEDYLDRVNDLRKEKNAFRLEPVKKTRWMKVSIKFIENHVFHTDEANALWAEKKEENVKQLKRNYKKRSLKKKKKSLKSRMERPGKETEKGIETVFRTVMKNHVRFSEIADNKANIMLSINAIILSISLTVLVPRLDEHPEFILPMTVLVLVCLSSVVTATLSTRPKVTSGRTSQEAIAQKKANLLFFGNFHKMELKDYQEGMWQVMNDREYLYGSMMKDLYYLGVVLEKKYRYLRITYSVFMYGLILIILATVYAAVQSSHL